MQFALLYFYSYLSFANPSARWRRIFRAGNSMNCIFQVHRRELLRWLFVMALLASVTFARAAGPTITAQPQSTNILAGSTARFSVTATGSGTLSYRWEKD